MRTVSFEALIELQAKTIKVHGGLPGIKDERLVKGALERPLNIVAYEPEASPGRLAAAVCHGVARGHGFNDGNKRAAFLALNIQLRLLGYLLDCSQRDAVRVIQDIASGGMSEKTLATWIDDHLLPLRYR
jgi:death on curing protein